MTKPAISLKAAFRAALCILLLTGTLVSATAQFRRTHATPEQSGVASTGLLGFLDTLSRSRNEMHSFMLIRHGNVVAEGWWNPFAPELKHMMYSCSKSFTATAVGFAVQEGLLKLDDKVVRYFPELLPATVSPNLEKLTVRDVLIMSDGMDPDPSFLVAATDSNWIRGFLKVPVKYEPGTRFLYNSLGTYMLSAMVQKVSGQKIVDYLKPRLFDPLGIKNIDWEEDLQRINTGGWGLRLHTEDMARFATWLLQKGKWEGKQLLPESWIAEASKAQIMQEPDATAERMATNDWVQGYGYQLWRCRNNAFRGDGAYGQYMIVMPDQDAVLVITSETPDMQDILNQVWAHILPAMKPSALPEDPEHAALLQQRLNALAIPPAPRAKEALEKNLHKTSYRFSSNAGQLEAISFRFTRKGCSVLLTQQGKSWPLQFGAGIWREGSTGRKLNSLTSRAYENTDFLYPAKVRGSYTWTGADTLELRLRYIESPHTEYYRFTFSGNELVLDVSYSFDFGRKAYSAKAVKNP